MSCLVALDASLWAGIPVTRKETPDPSASLAPEVTSVLDQWEVERIMGFLESDDIGIRALVCLCNVSCLLFLTYFTLCTRISSNLDDQAHQLTVWSP